MNAPIADDAHQIAAEFVVWAAEQRWTPMRTLVALRGSWGGRGAPTWHDAELAVAIAWRRLSEPTRPTRRAA